MANMKKINFFHFLHTKAKEDELKRLNQVPNPEDLSEIVEIRDEPLQLLELFPWEMTKVLDQNDLKYFPGLELSQEFVHNRLFKYWDAEMVMHARVREKSITVNVYDLDTKTDHAVTFQKYFNEDKYCFREGWGKNFVERRGLAVGMKIGMYWDARTSSLRFSVLMSPAESSEAVPVETPGN